MKAIVTDTDSKYTYTIENVTNVNYVEKYLILVSMQDNVVQTYTYNAREVIIAIA